ncbi:metallophosphoesterase family protein [Sporobacter termitidis]|uniref:metallophosphoesterase family protein n=1 Tax=Sporobacter termitidis TaxID=44749 RepID=UPI0009338224|nr:metallophosphoesterase [Sporobacter termitidis]
MIKISFIHLSDIHFVKSSNNPADIDKALRDAIITDLTVNAKKLLNNISGILVTGDIAFSGARTEYEIAKKYLNEISDIFSIKPSDIYCVPGNHDIDQIAARESHIVYQEQCAIDSHSSIDDADKAFAKSINAPCFNDVLFEPIREYNEFASRFNCNISPKRITWIKEFELDYGLKLSLFGANSCYLSNSSDHQPGQPDRLMYIGQAQIPPRMADTAILLMCHHPPECWKFKSDLIDRINKRADIQLYGHMHTQSIELNDNNAILYSGATHPTRSADWVPRYNWITISSNIDNGDRFLNIEIYPRILSKNRDCFLADTANTTNGIYLRHSINIDKKRKIDLEDVIMEISNDLSSKDRKEYTNDQTDMHQTYDEEINERELIYGFYELSVVRQLELLGELELLSEDDKGKSMTSVLNSVIQRSKEQGKFRLLWNSIENKGEIE